jgi:hypothetical protein
LFPGELVWDAVVVTVNLDMVVDVDSGLFPLGILIRDGRQRFEGRLIKGFEEGFAGSVEFLELAGVEIFQGSGDDLIELSDVEEVMVSQGSQDPALCHKHSGLHFGFVSGMPNASRDHGGSVMLSEFQVSGVDVRFIPAGLADPCLEIVRDKDLRHPLEELEGMHMRSDPGGQILGGGGFSEGIAAGSEGGDKDLSLGDLTRCRINDGDCLAGIIHEELLAGPVLLS